MKLCVSAVSGSLEAQVDPRFGRCQYFIFVDSDTLAFEAVPNEAIGAGHGAGIQAAQTVAQHGAQLVLTGNVGPNAFQALSAAGIKVVTGARGTVRDAVKNHRDNPQGTSGPTVHGHHGLGPGRGQGRGLRKGR